MDTPSAAAPRSARVILRIERIAYRGWGVARQGGMVHLVSGVCRGEEVEAEVFDRRKSFAFARATRILERSADRLGEPDCRVPDTLAPGTEVRVPGCVYDHMSHEAEIREKSDQLRDFLARTAAVPEHSIDEAWRAAFVSPSATGYRNKAELHVGTGRDGSRAFGYFSDDNTTVVDMVRCPLSVPDISAAISETREDSHFAAWAPAGSRAVFRWSRRDGTALFIDRPGQRPDDGGGAFFTEDTPIVGSLEVPARGFWQMNNATGTALVSALAAAIEQSIPDNLIDLYCGVGVFALSAAALGVRRVAGVESGRDSVRAAIRNARRLGLNAKATFSCADVGRGAAKFVDPFASGATDVVVDPPRAGLAPELVRALLSRPPRRLFYVSCAPDTLARDLKSLCGPDGTFRLSSVQLFDMFPRTAHFETLCILDNKHRN